MIKPSFKIIFFIFLVGYGLIWIDTFNRPYDNKTNGSFLFLIWVCSVVILFCFGSFRFRFFRSFTMEKNIDEIIDKRSLSVFGLITVALFCFSIFSY